MKRAVYAVLVLGILFAAYADAKWPPVNSTVPGTSGECLINDNGNVGAATCGSGGGAPSGATYITQTPNGGLSAEQPLSTLATGLVFVTTSTGVLSTFVPSAPCTSGFHVSALNASGATTCTADTGSGGGGAPTDAKYITQTLHGSLSDEQSLGALTTGLLVNTVTAGTGVLTPYSGAAACSAGTHVAAISASGATTCTADTGGGGGGSQTPWIQAIDGGGFGLSNVASIAVAGTGAGAIKLGNATNSNLTGFQGSVVASEIIYTLPTADGSSGQFLSTNGSKILSWTTPAGAGTVTSSGPPTSGQAAEWTTATNLVGVATTGTGSYVKASGATLVNPILGTPQSGLATNLTGTAAGLTAGLATNTVAKTGNTSTYVTTTGAQTSGRCVTIDANGNHVAAAGGCGGSSSTLDGVRLFRSTNQPIPHNLETPLSFDTESYDNGGLHAGGAPTRITIVTTGVYDIRGAIDFAGNATGVRYASILLNGTIYIANVTLTPAVTTVLPIQLGTHYHLVATDYIELVVFQSSTVSLNVNAGPDYSPIFSAQLLTTP